MKTSQILVMKARRLFSGVFIVSAIGLTASTALGQGDKLIVPDANVSGNGTYLLPLSVAGAAPVTGMQFDIDFPPNIVIVGSAISAAATNHYAESRMIATGRRRVVMYSRSNALLDKDIVIDLPLEMAATAGSAVPIVHIRNLVFTKVDGTFVIPTVERGNITRWFFDHFTTADLANPSIVGDTADPDFDGLGNLVEYATAGTPKTPERNLGPELRLAANPQSGGNEWKFTYMQSRTAAGVEPQPEISEDLLSWTPVSGVPTGNGDALRLEFSVTVQVTAEGKKFFRLGVKRQ